MHSPATGPPNQGKDLLRLASLRTPGEASVVQPERPTASRTKSSIPDQNFHKALRISSALSFVGPGLRGKLARNGNSLGSSLGGTRAV